MSGRKVALVTGAARGLGRAICVRLAETGFDIIALDIGRQLSTVDYEMASTSDLDETTAAVRAAGGDIVTRLADVRSVQDLNAAVSAGADKFGRIDVIAANAAIAPWQTKGEDDFEIWHDVIDVNLTGAFNTVYAALPVMRQAGRGGMIVFTSSTAGLRGLGADSIAYQAYTASKTALVGLAKTMARQYGSESIRVNTVHPAGMKTPMTENEALAGVVAREPGFASICAPAMPGSPMDPREIANAVAWLASDDARYVTGVALPVDAGAAL